jgi:hypothetical protein
MFLLKQLMLVPAKGPLDPATHKALVISRAIDEFSRRESGT